MTKHLIVIGDSQNMLEIEDNSIDLVVSSPPYNVGKEYERFQTDAGYKKLAKSVSLEIYQVLKPDGRFCINVPFTMNFEGHSQLNLKIWLDALLNASLKIRDNIIWNQLNTEIDTAWGSWRSASSPWLRHMTEQILVGYKLQWKKLNRGESDISSKEFVRWSLDIWEMNTARRNEGHPATYPDELPFRCLKMFSYIGDTVLDPFLDSGTTTKVARKLGRNSVGYELNSGYRNLILEKIGARQKTLSETQDVFEVIIQT